MFTVRTHASLTSHPTRAVKQPTTTQTTHLTSVSTIASIVYNSKSCSLLSSTHNSYSTSDQERKTTSSYKTIHNGEPLHRLPIGVHPVRGIRQRRKIHNTLPPHTRQRQSDLTHTRHEIGSVFKIPHPLESMGLQWHRPKSKIMALVLPTRHWHCICGGCFGSRTSEQRQRRTRPDH